MAMKKTLTGIALLLVAIFTQTATLQASDFIDTGMPDKSIGVGIRFGVNTSNSSGSLKGYSDNTSYSWRTGFNTGVVVDLNVREFFSIQPGLFFENRSYDYTIVRHESASQSLYNELGHTRSYSFNIPIMASFRFNLTDNLEWLAEAGPYFAFGVGGFDKNHQVYLQVAKDPQQSSKYYENHIERDFYGKDIWNHKKFDWGFKLGTGFRLHKCYLFSIHYFAGCKNVSANPDWTMRNKSWSFALGYDF